MCTPAKVIDVLTNSSINLDERKAFQERWTLKEKGWLVDVEWKESTYGLGTFALQDIAAGTILRVGRVGYNMLRIDGIEDVLSFIGNKGDPYHEARVRYVSDFLFSSQTFDENGKPMPGAEERRFYMMVPGFGTNHSGIPNLRLVPPPDGLDNGILLVAAKDIRKGEELVNDYNLCGKAPDFLHDFLQEHNLTMIFSDCNDFVSKDALQQ